MKKNKTLKLLAKQIEIHRNNIGKERDALRALQDEIESLLDPVDRGIESLDCAIQEFSEQA